MAETNYAIEFSARDPNAHSTCNKRDGAGGIFIEEAKPSPPS